MRVGIAFADVTAGNLLALAIMMALYRRERTGKGAFVHTSLLESQLFVLDFQASRWLMAGEVAGQTGNDHPTIAPRAPIRPPTDTSTSRRPGLRSGSGCAR
jgi:formyl-CoA transferase